jgi:hypothetical protein
MVAETIKTQALVFRNYHFAILHIQQENGTQTIHRIATFAAAFGIRLSLAITCNTGTQRKTIKSNSGLEYLFFIITGIFSNETLLHPPSELVCIYSGSGSTTPEPLPVTDGANGYYAIKSTKRPNQWLGLFDVIYAS